MLSSKRVNELVRKYKKPELIQMCEQKGIFIEKKETKQELATKLCRGDGTAPPFQGNNNSSSVTATKFQNPVILIQKVGDHYEHPSTGLIFDEVTRLVVGYKDQEGNIRPLNRRTIEICKQYKFRFQIPDSLDADPELPLLPLLPTTADLEGEFDEDNDEEDEL